MHTVFDWPVCVFFVAGCFGVFMSERVFLQSVDPWKIEESGMTGWSAWYSNNYRDGDNGFKPTKSGIVDDLAKSLLGKLPCLANVSFSSRPGAGNKATLVITSVEIVAPVDFPAFLNAPTPKKPAA